MSRLVSLTAAIALLIGCAGAALAQSPSYTDRLSTPSDRSMTADRYTTNPDRSSPNVDRYATSRDRYATQRHTMPERQANPTDMAAGQFASEAEARSNCRNDTVVWVNTKSHVYHLPGTSVFGHTKHGAFMCRADADRSGTFRAAKNEKPARGLSGGSMPR